MSTDLISEDRQLFFARRLVDQIYHDDLADYSDDDQALRVAKMAIAKFTAEQSQIDENVREKIRSLKKTVSEGSLEWDTMYRKYYEEELRRRG